MKPLLIAFACCMLFATVQAADAIQSNSHPDYCVEFSPEACARIKAVIDSKIRPTYCVPGFARADSGLNLTSEQLRICYAQPPAPLSPEMRRAVADHEARQNQIAEDARAMLRESREKYRRLISMIAIGYNCDVIDQLSADAATLKIQTAMLDEQIHAGVIGDPKMMSVHQFIVDLMQTGKDAAANGACTRLTPAVRGNIRSLASDLMR